MVLSLFLFLISQISLYSYCIERFVHISNMKCLTEIQYFYFSHVSINVTTYEMQNQVKNPLDDFCHCCVHYIFLENTIWKPMDPSKESPEAAVIWPLCHLSLQMQPLHAPSVALWLLSTATCSGAITFRHNQNLSHVPQCYQHYLSLLTRCHFLWMHVWGSSAF